MTIQTVSGVLGGIRVWSDITMLKRKAGSILMICQLYCDYLFCYEGGGVGSGVRGGKYRSAKIMTSCKCFQRDSIEIIDEDIHQGVIGIIKIILEKNLDFNFRARDAFLK